eukprot:6511834-Prymnesium_polylepis.2
MERADELREQAAKELSEAKEALLKAGREAREAAVARRDKEQKEIGRAVPRRCGGIRRAALRRCGIERRVLRRCGIERRVLRVRVARSLTSRAKGSPRRRRRRRTRRVRRTARRRAWRASVRRRIAWRSCARCVRWDSNPGSVALPFGTGDPGSVAFLLARATLGASPSSWHGRPWERTRLSRHLPFLGTFPLRGTCKRAERCPCAPRCQSLEREEDEAIASALNVSADVTRTVAVGGIAFGRSPPSNPMTGCSDPPVKLTELDIDVKDAAVLRAMTSLKTYEKAAEAAKLSDELMAK